MASVSHMPSAGDEFTVCFWYKPDDQLAVTHGYGWDWAGQIASWSANGIGFAVGSYNTGTGTMIVRTTDGTTTGNSNLYNINVGAGALDLPPDEFAHFAITVNSAREITGMWVNGEYVAKTTGTTGYNVTDANTGIFGARFTNGVAGNGNSGFLDDFAVIKGQLTEAEIRKVMTLGVAVAIPEPSTFALLVVGCWLCCLCRRMRR
ncbi:MAG TPA: hypothetical protein DD670_02840 [Planctomycetaceae bacterium]|nr:hypothetical protein [Planctomycetaceae bacterium]